MTERPRAVSLKDVASAAGVAVGTVSHVLNDNKAARISADTQARIRRIAQDLGYRPNRMARSLVRGRTDTMGAFVPDLDDPLNVSALQALCGEIEARGYQTLCEIDTRLGMRMEFAAVDGILLWSLPHRGPHEPLVDPARCPPTVYLGDAPKHAQDSVRLSATAGQLELTAHLLRLGYRRFAFAVPLVDEDDLPTDLRHLAAIDSLTLSDAAFDVCELPGHEQTQRAGLEVGLKIGERPPDERPDVVVAYNDSVAIGVIAGLKRRGLSVPDDVGVTGFGGIADGMALERVLTSMRIPVREICAKGVEFLDLRISEPGLPPQHVSFPLGLMKGETTKSRTS